MRNDDYHCGVFHGMILMLAIEAGVVIMLGIKLWFGE